MNGTETEIRRDLALLLYIRGNWPTTAPELHDYSRREEQRLRADLARIAEAK